MSDEQTRKVAELIRGERFGFPTTITMDGRLTSRPMTLQEVEFDGDLWFFAERDTNPVTHITGSPEVNVGVGSGGTWASPSRPISRRRRGVGARTPGHPAGPGRFPRR
jgi:general stress protein 26